MDRIDELCDVTGNTRAEVVERALGLALPDQEKFVEQLEGAISGPLWGLVLNEKFLDVVFSLTGDVTDPAQLRAIKNVRSRARDRARGGLSVAKG